MAVEIKDGKKILVTPVSAEDLKDIHIGDIVYLTGDITTCRDVAHRRVVEERFLWMSEMLQSCMPARLSAPWEMTNTRWYP